MYSVEEKSFKELSDRKLGDMWEDWDGTLESGEGRINGPRSVFLSFAALGALIVNGLLALVFYMILPRLEAIGGAAPIAAGVLFVAVGAVYFIGYLIVLVPVSGIRIRVFGFLARRLIGLFRAPAFRLGRLFGVSSDRMSASYITLHNSLVEASGRRAVSKEDVLVLLPRCLTKEHLNSAREIAKELGCRAAVAGGGTAARKLIAKHKPRAIIAVACERDLYSGLVDLGTRIDTLGLTNNRPNGPCKDTEFDVESFRKSIRFFTEGLKVKS
jgi:hypothetical protein